MNEWEFNIILHARPLVDWYGQGHLNLISKYQIFWRGKKAKIRGNKPCSWQLDFQACVSYKTKWKPLLFFYNRHILSVTIHTILRCSSVSAYGTQWTLVLTCLRILVWCRSEYPLLDLVEWPFKQREANIQDHLSSNSLQYNQGMENT